MFLNDSFDVVSFSSVFGGFKKQNCDHLVIGDLAKILVYAYFGVMVP